MGAPGRENGEICVNVMIRVVYAPTSGRVIVFTTPSLLGRPSASSQPMSSLDSKHVLMLVENNSFPQDLRVRKEAAALRRAGYQVSAIAPRSRSQPWTERVDGVQVYRYRAPRGGAGIAGYIWEYAYSMAATMVLMCRVYVRSPFHAIHAANPPDIFVFLALPFIVARVKFVFDHHDLSPEMFRARFRGPGSAVIRVALLFCERVSCKLASLVIATNEAYQELEISRCGVDPSKTVVVRNAPDLAVLRRRDADPALRLPAKLILCYVGEIGHHDGVDYLIRALRVLRYGLCRRDFHCWIVGDGDAQRESKLMASEFDLDECVTFVGRVEHHEVVVYLSSADICLAPEPSNGYNDLSTMIKIGEYMAIGVPIVAFDLAEHRRWAGDSACYARVNDVDSFAQKIVDLAEDPEVRKRMGAAGKERVRTKYSWPAQESILIDAYRRMFSGASNNVRRDKSSAL